MQSDYEKECNEKLLHIKDTRQRQAAVGLHSGIVPQGAQTSTMQNQLQGGFPQQMNRTMQSSPVPGQPQMSMGMSDPNQQAATQQRQHLQQQQQQSAMFQQRAQPQPRSTNNASFPDDISTLSPQELEHVSRLATTMQSRTGPEDMEKIKINLGNLNAEQRQYIARKKLDPMTYFFRTQALTYIRRHRQARMGQAGRPQNNGMDPNAGMMGDPMMNPNQQQIMNMLNLQRTSAFSGGNPAQGLDPSAFPMNVENIQGQQADGLRSQEAGQLVVPASSSQMNQQPFNNGQNMFPQQMGQNGQGNMNGAGVNPQMFMQQHLQNGSNGAQDRMQFQSQSSQAAQAQARAAAAQKAQMAMSAHGGQANPQSQTHMPQSSPVMPMLNQPMAPNQMSPAQVSAQSRPPSHPSNMGQHQPGMQGVAQPALQGRPQIPPNLPQPLQDQLSRMTNEQLQVFLANQRRIAMARNQQAAQAGQAQGMFNGQMGGNGRMRNQMGMQQAMNPGQLQPQSMQGQQQLTPQQRAQQQQQRQNEVYKAQLLRAQSGGMEMSAEQVQEMDRTNFPPSIVNGNTFDVPQNIRTWGQLKQWTAANPQPSAGPDLNKLMTLQKLHFTQIVTSQQVNGQNGPGHHLQGIPQPMGNPQNFSAGQTQGPAGMGPMRQITPGDIQTARHKLGPAVDGYTDDQMRELLRARQKQIVMQALQNRQMNGGRPPVQNQSMPQPAVSATQNAPQVNPLAMSQPQQAMGGSQPSNAKAQPGGSSSKGGKAPAAKQAPKKRANASDTGERRAATATPQQPQPSTLATGGAPRPVPSLTSEQYAAMSPQQRLQVEAHMRKQQQSLMRGPIPNKAAADEAWQKNVPRQLQTAYEELKKAPIADPQPLTQEQKDAMAKQLTDNLDVLSKMDTLVVQSLGQMQGQERNIKNILAMRVQLMRQFKPGSEWVVNDHFTITPDYLTGAILFIRKVFQLMIRANQERQRPNANQPPVSATSTSQAGSTGTALNATNLQQLQQEEAQALQQARRASSQSATVAPAPFGAPSPQGVPHAYGPGGLAPEKLKLPPPKKRKQSHAGTSASPVQPNAPAVAAAAAKYKQAVADGKSTAAALSGAFKCSVVECQHHYQGFPTQAALDKHVEDNHQPEEEEAIGSPLQYYIDSIAIGLGLDRGAEPQQPATAGPAVTTNNQATKVGAVASPAKQGLGTPATTSTTPMVRATSQLATKAVSPATSTQQLTPQPVPGKGAKPSPSQDAPKQPGKRTWDESEAKDAWADCPMSQEKIQECFAPVFSDPRLKALGYDPIDEFMNTDMFSDSEDTPDSAALDAAIATLTPTDEDAKDGAKDGAKDADDIWAVWTTPWTKEMIDNTVEWMKIPPELLDTGPDGLQAPELNWELLESQNKEAKLDKLNKLNKPSRGGGVAIAAL